LQNFFLGNENLLLFLGIAAGNWIEVAYGTATGTVCVIVQHPELVGQGFQLFQTFTVHRNPVSKVMLSEKHLVSGMQEYTGILVCSNNNTGWIIINRTHFNCYILCLQNKNNVD